VGGEIIFMNIEILKMSSSEFKMIIYQKFKGKIFHITNEKNYKNILQSGAILATNNIENPNINWGSESSQSYFRTKNCISVCDLFHNKNENKIIVAMDKYSCWNPNSVVKDKVGYYLVLKESIYDKCITWNSLSQNEWLGTQIVHDLESGIADKILLSDIEYIIKLVTTEQSRKEIENIYDRLLNELKEQK